MPIYAYRCSACGHAKDVLQKISDPLLTVCPSCGADSFVKQLTAAGFQLKGSGWYVTDFKGKGAAAPKAATAGDAADAKPDAKPAGGDGPGGSSSTGGSGGESSSSGGGTPPPAASAGGCGASCACH